LDSWLLETWDVEVFDSLDTQLALEPVAPFTWPPHVKWARYGRDIQGTESSDRWYARISKKELETHGCKSSEQTQIKFLAERLVRTLKGDDYVTEMKTLFSLDRTHDLHAAVEQFVMALAAALHREEWDDLDELVELLTDALGFIDESTPDAKTGQKGTLLGSSLTSFPNGARLVDDARSFLVRAVTTKEKVDLCDVLLTRFKNAIVDVKDLLVCDDKVSAEPFGVIFGRGLMGRVFACFTIVCSITKRSATVRQNSRRGECRMMRLDCPAPTRTSIIHNP
jgi:hypothetical protein